MTDRPTDVVPVINTMHRTPTLTTEHRRTLRYLPAEHVLLQASDGGIELASSPYLGVVISTTGTEIRVQHRHQAEDDEPLRFSRRSGQLMDRSQVRLRLLGKATKPAEPLDDGDYLQAQQQLLSLAMVVDHLPLAGMLERITRAHTLGPVTDPSTYQAGLPMMQAVERLAKALQPFQAEARELAAAPEAPA